MPVHPPSTHSEIRDYGPLPANVRKKARNNILGIFGFTVTGEWNRDRFPEIREYLEYLDLAWREEPRSVTTQDVWVPSRQPGHL